MRGSFCHWIADNVDHNLRTLNGSHCDNHRSKCIQTRYTKIPKDKIEKRGQTGAEEGDRHVRPNISGLSKLSLKTYDALKTTYTPPKDTMIE